MAVVGVIGNNDGAVDVWALSEVHYILTRRIVLVSIEAVFRCSEQDADQVSLIVHGRLIQGESELKRLWNSRTVRKLAKYGDASTVQPNDTGVIDFTETLRNEPAPSNKGLEAPFNHIERLPAVGNNCYAYYGCPVTFDLSYEAVAIGDGDALWEIRSRRTDGFAKEFLYGVRIGFLIERPVMKSRIASLIDTTDEYGFHTFCVPPDCQETLMYVQHWEKLKKSKLFLTQQPFINYYVALPEDKRLALPQGISTDLQHLTNTFGVKPTSDVWFVLQKGYKFVPHPTGLDRTTSLELAPSTYVLPTALKEKDPGQLPYFEAQLQFGTHVRQYQGRPYITVESGSSFNWVMSDRRRLSLRSITESLVFSMPVPITIVALAALAMADFLTGVGLAVAAWLGATACVSAWRAVRG